MGADDSFEQSALRRHRRYQEEIVERYAVCPWAKSARQTGRVRAHVVADVQCDATRLKALVDAWADDEACDVAFIILPRFDGGMDAYDPWTGCYPRPHSITTAQGLGHERPQYPMTP